MSALRACADVRVEKKADEFSLRECAALRLRQRPPSRTTKAQEIKIRVEDYISLLVIVEQICSYIFLRFFLSSLMRWPFDAPKRKTPAAIG